MTDGRSPPDAAPSGVAAIAIGRNEGARLLACLASLRDRAAPVIYVDSGSTDGSAEAARAAGVVVVALDMDRPFTAARARNAGLARLAADGASPPRYVQFVDADCEMRPGWIAEARAFLDAAPRAAIVCGRLRERHPEASIWNAMIDDEWDRPAGPARACGGIAMMRTAPLLAAGGFDPALIAGEEPELCLRLRAAGWEVWRIDAEMAWHDAALTSWRQWWQRARRAGHTYAEGAAMHGRGPERHKVAELGRALAWGLVVPLVTLAGLFVTPWAALLLLVWPARILRLRARGTTWPVATFTALSALPAAQGALGWAWRRATRARPRLIEYK